MTRNFIARADGFATDDRGRAVLCSAGHPVATAWRYLGNIARGEAEEFRRLLELPDRDQWPDRRRFAEFQKKRDALAFVAKRNRTFAQQCADELAEARRLGHDIDACLGFARQRLASLAEDLRGHLSRRHIKFNRQGAWHRQHARGTISQIRRIRRASAWLESQLPT